MSEQVQDAQQTEQPQEQQQGTKPNDFWSKIDPDVKDALETMPKEQAAEFLMRLKNKKRSAYDEAKQYRLEKEKLEKDYETLQAKIEKEKKEAERSEMSKIEALEDRLKEYQTTLEQEKQNKLELARRNQEVLTRLDLIKNGSRSDDDTIDTLTVMLQNAKQREGDEFNQEQWLTNTKQKFPAFFTETKQVPANTGLPPTTKGVQTKETDTIDIGLKVRTREEDASYRDLRAKYGLTRQSLGY